MTRRDVVRVVARLAVTTAGQGLLTSWLNAAHYHPPGPPEDVQRWRDYAPRFFSATEYRALDQFTAVLIPTDATPGAREGHVAQFIDFILSEAAEDAPEMQAEWRDAMKWLLQEPFLDRPIPQQNAFVSQISQAEDRGFRHFQMIKHLTVYSFYTSRAGLIDNLEYKGLAYLTEFPGCSHPDHQAV